MTWIPAAAPQPLTENAVHLWRFRTDGSVDIAGARRLLSGEELVRADRYRSEDSHRSFTISRARLRQVLAGYLDVATDEVVLTTERFGKAALAENPALPRLEFNVSHSGDQGLLAVTPRLRVGVDVEKHGRAVNLAAVAESTFTHYETHTWRSVPEEGTVQGFFDTWVLKEAFVKATGLGIGYGLRNFEVSIVGEPVLRSIHGNEEVAKGWTLVLLDSDAGYSSGLAVEGSDIGHLTFEIE